jgi:hypothetical protein
VFLRGHDLLQSIGAIRTLCLQTTYTLSSMINSRRTNTNINGEDVERFLHKARAVVERRAAVQLGCRHPQLSLRVDPHGIHPKKTLVANEHRHCTVGRNLEDFLLVKATNVDIALCIDCCPAWKTVSSV